jgi:hypothetical protein
MSREELLALLSVQAKTIDVLTARVDALEAENAELQQRLAQNSRNSSKPPSSDTAEHTPPRRSLRSKTGHKPGKQPGAQGFSLKLIDDPHEVFDYVPDCCRGCGTDLHDAASAGVVNNLAVKTVSTSAADFESERAGVPGKNQLAIYMSASRSIKGKRCMSKITRSASGIQAEADSGGLHSRTAP